MSKIPEDVTDQLRAKGCDINAEDRVYLSRGRHVKVRTLHDLSSSGHGHEVFRFSGSIVSTRDGKAVRRADGAPAVHDQGEHLTVMNDTPINLVNEIEKARFVCVERTLIAHGHYNASQGLTGVKVVGSKTSPEPIRVTQPKGFK